MSTTVSVAGSNYSVPQEGDSGWANDVTNLLIQLATSSKVLQITSTSFPLLQELSFGNSYGLKLAYVKSTATNPSSVGTFRLGNAETISWRNAANNADLDLKVSATDELQYNSVKIPVSGSIVNADINAAAAIAYSKLSIADGDLTIAKTNGLQTALNTAAPMTTAGDMIRGGESGVPTRLAIGSVGTILRSDGSAPGWSSALTIDASNNATLSSAGAKTFSVYGTTGGDASTINIGNASTAGGCNLFFIANAGGTGLTIQRSAGTNNISNIIHYGTSAFNINCNGAALMDFKTSNTSRLQLSSGGDLTLTSAGSKTFTLAGGTSGDSSTINLGNTANGTATINLIGNSDYSAGGLILQRGSGANGNSFIDHKGTGNLYLRAIQAGGINLETNSVTRMTISSAGAYQLNALTTNGTLTTTSSNGTLAVSSNANMKIADGEIENALGRVNAITPRYFYWKPETNFGSDRQLGFFAQEVNQILGEEVANTPADGVSWGIYDRGLVAMAFKAIQELSAKVDLLTEKVAILENNRG